MTSAPYPQKKASKGCKTMSVFDVFDVLTRHEAIETFSLWFDKITEVSQAPFNDLKTSGTETKKH